MVPLLVLQALILSSLLPPCLQVDLFRATRTLTMELPQWVEPFTQARQAFNNRYGSHVNVT